MKVTKMKVAFDLPLKRILFVIFAVLIAAGARALGMTAMDFFMNTDGNLGSQGSLYFTPLIRQYPALRIFIGILTLLGAIVAAIVSLGLVRKAFF
jgi:hypothetical protein